MSTPTIVPLRTVSPTSPTVRAMTTFCYAAVQDGSLPPVSNRRDLGISPSPSVYDCTNLFAATEDCSAFTLTSGGSSSVGSCVLKPTYGNGVVTPGAVSGLVDKSKGERCHGLPFVVDNALLVSGDLATSSNSSIPAKTVAECFHWCAVTPLCDRFTWTRTGTTGGVCWLKDATTQGFVVC